MASCAVPTCQNSEASRPDLDYHPVPKEPSIREGWLNFCGMRQIQTDTYICSQHFHDACYDKPLSILFGKQERPNLYRYALPTILRPPPPPKTFQDTYNSMIGGQKQFAKSTPTPQPTLRPNSTPDMEIIEYRNVCRVCLVNVHTEPYVLSLADQQARKILFECTSVQSEPGDNYPQQLCINCWNQCMTWSEFKSMAQTTDRKLRLVVRNEDKGIVLEERDPLDIENLLCVNVMELVSPEDPVDRNGMKIVTPEDASNVMGEVIQEEVVKVKEEPLDRNGMKIVTPEDASNVMEQVNQEEVVKVKEEPVDRNVMEFVSPENPLSVMGEVIQEEVVMVKEEPVDRNVMEFVSPENPLSVMGEVIQEEVVKVKEEPVEYLEGYSLAEGHLEAPSIGNAKQASIAVRPARKKTKSTHRPRSRRYNSHMKNKYQKNSVEKRKEFQKKMLEKMASPVPHQCYICDMRFSDKDHLDRHKILIHSIRNQRKCLECDEIFKFKYELSNHLLAYHPLSKSPVNSKKIK